MKKIRIGVIGAGRGKNLFERGELIPNAEFVAMCDKWKPGLESFKGKCATYMTTMNSWSMTWMLLFWRIMRMNMHLLLLKQ